MINRLTLAGAAALVASVLGTVLTASTPPADPTPTRSPAAAQELTTAQAEAAEWEYRVRSHVCNAHDRGSSSSETVDWLVSSYDFPREVTADYVQYVWPSC